MNYYYYYLCNWCTLEEPEMRIKRSLKLLKTEMRKKAVSIFALKRNGLKIKRDRIKFVCFSLSIIGLDQVLKNNWINMSQWIENV